MVPAIETDKRQLARWNPQFISFSFSRYCKKLAGIVMRNVMRLFAECGVLCRGFRLPYHQEFYYYKKACLVGGTTNQTREQLFFITHLRNHLLQRLYSGSPGHKRILRALTVTDNKSRCPHQI